SRRRHTRWPRDWSSDVCSSDLVTEDKRYIDLAVRLLNMRDLVVKGDDDNQDRIPFRQQITAHGHAVRATYLYAGAADIYSEMGRSEERRVGKECRSRWLT